MAEVACPLVSVNVIFLNPGRFLVEAVESVFAQTYPAWELLLVDDGSTDESSGIARDYARRFPDRVRCLEHDGHANRGMSASRNLGNWHARGRYVGCLDADDVWLPEKLERQVALLEAHPDVAMVYGPGLFWKSWMPGGVAGQSDAVQDTRLPANTVVRPPDLLRVMLQDESASPIGALLRREAIEAIGGYDESYRTLYEDMVFYSKLAVSGSAYVSSECWYWYRSNPSSASSVAFCDESVWPARVRYLEWMARYLAAHGSWPQVDRLLRRQLRVTRRKVLRSRARGLLKRHLPAGAYAGLRKVTRVVRQAGGSTA